VAKTVLASYTVEWSWRAHPCYDDWSDWAPTLRLPSQYITADSYYDPPEVRTRIVPTSVEEAEVE
jgi:hypothetical protein